MSSLRDAATFLTRVPLHRESATAPNMSEAVPWFPVVGAALGALQGAVFVGLADITTPALAAALAVALLALITGAFHHDGLADMADAFGGGWTREQRLEIMKDSRLGTYGVTALVLVLVIEVTALASLTTWTAFAATTTAHSLSRAVAIGVMITATPAGDTGLGVDYLRGLSRPAVVAASAAALLITAILFGIYALAPIAGAYGAGIAVVSLANAKIGGISGDVLGAIQQLAKIAILIAIVIIATNIGEDPGNLAGIAL